MTINIIMNNNLSTIDEPIWQKRETLSFNSLDGVPIKELVNQILIAVIENQELEWQHTQLTITDEAMIQKKLRDRNIELQCYNLDLFPTNTTQLSLLLYKPPMKLLLERLISSWCKTIFNEILLCITFYTPLLIILVIAGIFYYHADLLLESLLATWLICGLAFIHMHEYWAHDYIEPRNKFIGYVFDILTNAILWQTPKPRKRTHLHIYHHRFFRGPMDQIEFKIDNNTLFNYIFSYKMLADDQLDKWTLNQNDKDFAIKYKKLDIVQQFLETNAILILILTHIVFLWGLGIHYYLYFILVPMLTFEVLYYYFLEVVVHKIVKGDIDMPWTYPIMLNCAYHSTHHLQGDKLVLGPKPIRYLNPQYYFVRLFYKVKVEIV